MKFKALGAFAALTSTLVLAGCVSATVDPYEPAPDISVAPTSSSIPDYSGVSLPAVTATTNTPGVDVRGGRATIRGTVRIGGQNAGGAVVIIERFVDNRSSSISVTTNDSGYYSAGDLQGGRFRVRAYRAPDATTNQAQVFFMNNTDTKTQDLNLDGINGNQGFSFAINPSPPILGELANLGVSVTRQEVGSDGVARTAGVSGVTLQLQTGGGRTLAGGSPIVTTDGGGRAQWSIRCNSLDDQFMRVQLPDGSIQPVNVAGCQLPPPTTTTTSAPLETPAAPPTQ